MPHGGPLVHTPRDRELKPVNSLGRHHRDGTHDTNILGEVAQLKTHTQGNDISGLKLAMLLYITSCLARPLPCTENRVLCWPFSLISPGTAPLSSRADIFTILTC